MPIIKNDLYRPKERPLKVHLLKDGRIPACGGWSTSPFTESAEDVTCEKCKAFIRRMTSRIPGAQI